MGRPESAIIWEARGAMGKNAHTHARTHTHTRTHTAAAAAVNKHDDTRWQLSPLQDVVELQSEQC